MSSDNGRHWRAHPRGGARHAVRALVVCMLAATAPLHAQNAPLRIELSQPSVTGGNSVAGLVTLTAADASARIVTIGFPPLVNVLSPARAGAIQNAGTLRLAVAPGVTSVSFTATPAPTATRTILELSATLGTSVVRTTLIVNPPSLRSVVAAPASLIGGGSAQVTIALDGTVPPGPGMVIALQAFPPLSTAQPNPLSDVITAPATVTVPPFASTVSVAIATKGVASTQRFSISADTLPSSSTGTATSQMSVTLVRSIGTTLTILPPAPVSLRLDRSRVFGGMSVTGTVTLNGPAPDAGLPIALAVSSRNASVPTTITVPGGATSQTFPISTPGFVDTFQSADPVLITARPAAATGTNVFGTPAPPASTTITDGSSNTVIVSSNPTAALRVDPMPILQAVTVDSTSFTGGSAVQVTLTFQPGVSTNGAFVTAPDAFATPLALATVTTDQPALLTVPPIGIRPGVLNPGMRVVAGIPPGAVAVPVTLSAQFNGVVVKTLVLLHSPVPPIGAFTLRPSSVIGGANAVLQLQLSTGIATPQSVQLSSDHPDLVAVPASVSLSPAQPARAVTLVTHAVTASTPVTITMNAGAQRQSVVLTLAPPAAP